jgi:hypothetical protein
MTNDERNVNLNAHKKHKLHKLSGGDMSWTKLEPRKWNKEIKACAGKSQSPINIVNSKTRYKSTLAPFKFINYDKKFSWEFTVDEYTSLFFFSR